MKRELCLHAIDNFLSQGETPECVITRGSQIWRVVNQPIVAESDVSHHLVTDGDYVRIPLHPYLIGDSPLHVVGAALELGTAIPQLPGASVLRLILGDPITREEDKLRVWLGVAWRIK